MESGDVKVWMGKIYIFFNPKGNIGLNINVEMFLENNHFCLATSSTAYDT